MSSPNNDSQRGRSGSLFKAAFRNSLRLFHKQSSRELNLSEISNEISYDKRQTKSSTNEFESDTSSTITPSPLMSTNLMFSPIIIGGIDSSQSKPSAFDLQENDTPEPTELYERLGQLQQKRDSTSTNNKSASKNKARAENRMTRIKKVDETEKMNLLSRLQAMLHAVESTLEISEKELETHLENHDFILDRAVSDYLERSGLRQIEINQTLKKIDIKEDSPAIKNAWSQCDPSVFNVRCGPQYRKLKLKAPADSQPIYDMVAVDMYSSDEKVEHMSRFMRMGDLERDQGSHPLPGLFIVNFMLPLCEPRMFSSDANGATVAFHFVMKLSNWAKQNPDHPSVQLAARFINESGPGESMRERLKIIVQVANPDEMSLGKVERGLCRQYNGLPFLYRSYNSKYHRGFGWFQADFDGHKSGYATRLARHSLLGWSAQIVANVAFLVEAETDEEMPERVLGCANVHRLNCRNAPKFTKPSATPYMWTPTCGLTSARQSLNSLLSDDDSEYSGKRKHADSLLREPEENFCDATGF